MKYLSIKTKPSKSDRKLIKQIRKQRQQRHNDQSSDN